MSTALAFLLRSLRMQSGLNQRRLAIAAGVDPGYVNQIEKGRPVKVSRAVVEQFVGAMRLSRYEGDRLLLTAGYLPWSLSPEDTRLLLEIGGRIAQSAASSKERTG
jgi:transcriptional regulator with XRE-family HTH domain